MKVILREDLDKLGRRGDVVEVADGYARNFLVPKGKAILASDGAIKQASVMRRQRDIREAQARSEAESMAAQLARTPIEMKVRAGDTGRLFGSVTASDLVDEYRKRTGVTLDRKLLQLDEPIKEVGSYEISVKLFADVRGFLVVTVAAEDEAA
ncbi:MAG: 50S ribosomal protein L9 [Actinobacteria bacterium]|nr:50S ribosomal protein L9 [Actinomycetota bacterium]MCB9390022.1 50S ribosomal protein L9 [Acidimicrobiia bacterium]